MPVYDAIKNVKQDPLSKDKDVIGFIGAPWTILVYMLNKQSPKKQLNNEMFKDKKKIKDLFNIIDIFLKIHIKKQIESGASIIQIFDSWAGLVDHHDIDNYIYEPTIKLVNYIKSLNTPVICFPRNIIDYIEQTPKKVSLAYVPQQRKVSHYLRTNKTNYILITKNVKTGDEYRWIGDEEE